MRNRFTGAVVAATVAAAAALTLTVMPLSGQAPAAGQDSSIFPSVWRRGCGVVFLDDAAGDIFGETSRDIPMPITYRLDHARRIIVETWSGAVNEAELATHWRGYLADPDVMHCRRTLVDLREAEIAFTGSELAGLVHRIVAPVLGDRKWVSAILVASPLQYGSAR